MDEKIELHPETVMTARIVKELRELGARDVIRVYFNNATKTVIDIVAGGQRISRGRWEHLRKDLKLDLPAWRCDGYDIGARAPEGQESIDRGHHVWSPPGVACARCGEERHMHAAAGGSLRPICGAKTTVGTERVCILDPHISGQHDDGDGRHWGLLCVEDKGHELSHSNGDRYWRTSTACKHEDSVRFGWDVIDGHMQLVFSSPLFICRLCSEVAPHPQSIAADWSIKPEAFPDAWPEGSCFRLLAYRNPAYEHPILKPTAAPAPPPVADPIEAFLGGTPAHLAAQAIKGLGQHLGHEPTGDDARTVAERLRAMASELGPHALRADERAAKEEGWAQDLTDHLGLDGRLKWDRVGPDARATWRRRATALRFKWGCTNGITDLERQLGAKAERAEAERDALAAQVTHITARLAAVTEERDQARKAPDYLKFAIAWKALAEARKHLLRHVFPHGVPHYMGPEQQSKCNVAHLALVELGAIDPSEVGT